MDKDAHARARLTLAEVCERMPGGPWRPVDVMALAADRGIGLDAAPPGDALGALFTCDFKTGALVQKPHSVQRRAMGHVLQKNAAELAQFGDTELTWCRMSDVRLSDDEPAGTPLFLKPVRVTLDDVRVTAGQLQALVHAGGRAPTDEPVQAPTAGGPKAMMTRHVADLFDGLRFTADQWRRELGQNRLIWIKKARVSAGGRGKGQPQSTWDPVALGAALLGETHAGENRAISEKNVRARFTAAGPGGEWLDAWKTYEAEHLGSK